MSANVVEVAVAQMGEYALVNVEDVSPEVAP
jgi:hypothetical protein